MFPVPDCRVPGHQLFQLLMGRRFAQILLNWLESLGLNQASVMSKFSLSQRRPQRSRHTTYLCSLSVFSIPLFNRTSISSLESILTDATRSRMLRSFHSVIAVPACPIISVASSMWLFSSASSACCCSSFNTFGLQLCLLGKDCPEMFNVVDTIARGHSGEDDVKFVCQRFQLMVDIRDAKFSASAGMYHHL